MAIPENSNLIVLPYGDSGPEMLWQWESGFYFTQTGGYGRWVPMRFWLPVVNELHDGRPSATFKEEFRSFAISHQVTAIVAGPGTPSALLAELFSLKWRHQVVQGVHIFWVPGNSVRRAFDTRFAMPAARARCFRFKTAFKASTAKNRPTESQCALF